MNERTVVVTHRPGLSALLGLGLAAAALAACWWRRPTPLTPCARTAATAEAALELFDRPFAGEYAVGNVFDHDLPILAEDRNEYQLTTCGQRVGGLRGHYGYDWIMPTGTPLLAVADGRIVRAGQEPPIECFGRRRDGARVVVIETRPNGVDVIQAHYGHLERIDVTAGDSVRAGDVIGTSGNTGCSTAPHLHFSAIRVADGRREVWVDPFGWHARFADPWASDARGAPSLWLWRPRAAPRLFR